jgi:hypothetical protein
MQMWIANTSFMQSVCILGSLKSLSTISMEDLFSFTNFLFLANIFYCVLEVIFLMFSTSFCASGTNRFKDFYSSSELKDY